MPEFIINITSDCLFDPPDGGIVTSNGIINVSYTDPLSGNTFFTNQHYNVYPRETFNMPYNISDKVTNCSNLFKDCSSFDQPVVIGANVNNCCRMFDNCISFNQKVDIPSNSYCSSMFFNCYNFNRDVDIPESTTGIIAMFRYCTSFNKQITIPSRIENCSYLFDGCTNYNCPISIPNNVINCDRILCGCTNFNHHINIPESVRSIKEAFDSCELLETINIYSNLLVDNTWHALSNCNNLKTIHIIPDGNINCVNIIGERSNNIRLNIFVNRFDTLYGIESMFNDGISWSDGPSNYIYNDYHNIYIYYNNREIPVELIIVNMPQQRYPVGSKLDLGLIEVNAIYN